MIKIAIFLLFFTLSVYAKNEHKIIDAYFGMKVMNLNSSLFKFYNTQDGVLIAYIHNNKTASNVGLKKGDLVVGLNNKKIKNIEDFVSLLKNKKSNNILLQFDRNRLNKSIEIELAEINQNLLDKDSFSYKGMTLIDKKNIKGVYVSRIQKDSLSQKSGIRRGDIIFQIGENGIKNIKSMMSLVDENRRDKVFISRDGWDFIKIVK